MISKKEFNTIIPALNISEDISSIEWEIDKSTKNSLLIIQTNPKTNIEKIHNLLNNVKYAAIITNESKLNSLPLSQTYSDEEFFKVTTAFLHKLYPFKGKLIGVTGTNGKTTTVDLIRQLANINNISAASLGTLGLKTSTGECFENAFTTPPLVETYKILYKAFQTHELIAMEVSSHGLDQRRVFGLSFDCVAWTNLTQDHLDYHGNMEEYFNSKQLIMKLSKGPCFIIDSQQKLISKLENDKVQSIGFNKEWEAPEFIKKISFNRINFTLAKNCLDYIFPQKIINLNVEAPPGRFEIVKGKTYEAIVDYAHTPDALINICREMKETYEGKRLVVVFGCGGDRDRAKRPLMAKAVSDYADKIIVTSDNPRFEDPKVIIDDILPGLSKEYIVEADREKAIELGCLELDNNSVLLIAGKGHEDYQDIKGVKHNFCDKEKLEKYLG